MLESLFKKVAGLELHKSVKRRILQKNFKNTILVKICQQLLLQFLLLTVNIPFWVLVSTLNLMGLLQRSSSRLKKFSLGCFSDRILFYLKKKRNISWNGHSLTFVVTRCTNRCDSLSFVVIRCQLLCHSLSLIVPLVVIRCTTRCHSMYHSSVFL